MCWLLMPGPLLDDVDQGHSVAAAQPVVRLEPVEDRPGLH